MEDGQTLFDYNVGLNDIVQLLIRSQAESADSPSPREPSAPAAVSAPSAPSADPKPDVRIPAAPLSLSSPTAMETNTDNDACRSGGSCASAASETKPDAGATSNSANIKNGLKAASPTRDNQPPTSSRNTLTDPGIGVYKVRAVDARRAWPDRTDSALGHSVALFLNFCKLPAGPKCKLKIPFYRDILSLIATEHFDMINYWKIFSFLSDTC